MQVTNGSHSVACGFADGRRGSALIASFLQKGLDKSPPTQVSALQKAAFGRLVAQVRRTVEKFGRLYPSGHPAELGKISTGLGQNRRIEGSYSVDLRASQIEFIARGGVG